MRPRRIVWVGDDSGLPGLNSDVLCGSMVPVSDEDIKSNALVPRCFQKTDLNNLAEACGNKWIFKKQKGFAHKELHQSLVITSELARLAGCPIEYRNWKQFQNGIENDTTVVEDRALFVFCWTTEPDLKEVERVYKALQDRAGIQVRCYPGLNEIHESERKLGDIQAFDEIAAATDSLDYQYRPTTCSSLTSCTLQEPFVMKRTHSSSSSHISLDPKKTQVDKKLACRSRTPYKYSHSAPRWFHQQKVDSLIEFGEFRLIIATLPAKGALNGRAGHVFEAFHTKPQAKDVTNPIISVLNKVDDELLDEKFCGTRTYRHLKDYALWVFDELRRKSSESRLKAEPACEELETHSKVGDKRKASDDDLPVAKRTRTCNSPGKLSAGLNQQEIGTDHSEGMFESLEVGARLDIGVSSAADGHRFFLNEVTREWYGDLISFKTGDPKTRICSALAKARWRYLFGEI